MKEEKPRQSKASLRQNIALVIFGLFLCVVLLEVVLRLGGFVLLSMQEYRNLQSIKQKGAYRILCLGESTTQKQYPRFLEQTLNRRNLGVRFGVIDKGISGTNTSVMLSHIEAYLAEYRPNMVVAMMGINDRGKHLPFEAATSSKGMLFIRSCRTYKLIRLLGLHILAKAKEIGFDKSNKEGKNFYETRTYLPGSELKENPTESVSTEGSFKKAIDLNSKNDDAYVKLGWFYLGQGESSQAEILFKKAITLNPKNDNALAGLGFAYRWKGQFLQAEDVFKKVIELNPKNNRVYVELGWSYRDQKKFSQGEDLFKKVIGLNPKNDNAYIQLGRLYRDQDKFSQAEDAYKKVIEFNPKNGDVYLELGQLYRDQGRFLKAEDAFKQGIKFHPKKDNTFRAASLLYEEMSRPELAKEYTQKADRLGLEDWSVVTANNYRKLKEILDSKGIQLVCVQYPMRNVEPLKRIFEKDKGIVFVDNEGVFKEAAKKGSYKEYFRDMFGGDFGHCTEKGNRLLAQNIADVIFVEVFNKNFARTSTRH